MKILHLMRKEKFTSEIAEFYDKWFNNGEHDLCYVIKDDSTLVNDKLTIKQFEIKYSDLSKKLTHDFFKSYDFICLHSMFLDNYILKSIILRRIYKKIIWIEWGFDLYNYRQKGFLSFAKNFMNSFFRRNVNTIVFIFEPDIIYYKKMFKRYHSNVFFAPYIGPKIDEEFYHYTKDSRLNVTNLTNDTIYIQIGHSATRQIDHINVLNKLSRFKNENIKLVIPLSYGDKEYAKEVMHYAQSIFSEDKLLILVDYMPKDDYFEVLSRIDIAIFDTQRQIGLGNINRLIFRNTKIYMPSNSIMYDYFCSKGVPIQKIELIDDMCFETFRKEVFSNNDDHFKEYICSLSDYQNKLNKWIYIFESIRKTI